jgi:biotin transport system substrate-specific component
MNAKPREAKRASLARLTLTALFAALIAAGAFIAVPLPVSPVPVVLQNMFAALAGLVLGPLSGAAAVALYLAAGAIGLPVFAGASGGFYHFAGPTGGFLAGYLLAALVAGLVAGAPRAGRRTPMRRLALASALALLSVYVPGLLRLKAVLDASWPATLAAGFAPFVIGDALKAALAAALALSLRRNAASVLSASGN